MIQEYTIVENGKIVGFKRCRNTSLSDQLQPGQVPFVGRYPAEDYDFEPVAKAFIKVGSIEAVRRRGDSWAVAPITVRALARALARDLKRAGIEPREVRKLLGKR